MPNVTDGLSILLYSIEEWTLNMTTMKNTRAFKSYRQLMRKIDCVRRIGEEGAL